MDPELGLLCEENGRALFPRITGFGIAASDGAGRDPGLQVAADVFGLGAILFELLTGQPPREGQVIDKGAGLAQRAESEGAQGSRGDLPGLP